jgi:2-methylcitrate dehydratase PrpD
MKQEHFQASDVESIEIGVTRYTYDKLSYHLPETGLQGKFSMEYAVARALLTKRVTLEAFTDEAVQAVDAQELLRRIKMFVDEKIEREWKIGSRPVRAKIRLRDGRVLEKQVDFSKGNPEFPLTMEELRAKFTECARLSLESDAVHSAIRVIENLDDLDHVSGLAELLAGSGVALTARQST